MARSLLIFRCRALAAGLFLALPLAGCKDAPTVPSALQQLAGGEEWVAIPAPRELPGLESWLPYADRETPEGREALGLVQELSAAAERARGAGRLLEATRLEREAERVAVLSLARFPAPQELQRSLYALDFWADRVEAEVALDRAPEIAAALAEVKTARARAVTLLAAGDTTSAVLQMAAASERVREFTPTAVALRVLARVEGRLQPQAGRDPALGRALHLLASARQELLTGDPRRALRRALYALQLAHGSALPVEGARECEGPGC
jgi:hypothetical protein